MKRLIYPFIFAVVPAFFSCGLQSESRCFAPDRCEVVVVDEQTPRSLSKSTGGAIQVQMLLPRSIDLTDIKAVLHQTIGSPPATVDLKVPVITQSLEDRSQFTFSFHAQSLMNFSTGNATLEITISTAVVGVSSPSGTFPYTAHIPVLLQ